MTCKICGGTFTKIYAGNLPVCSFPCAAVLSRWRQAKALRRCASAMTASKRRLERGESLAAKVLGNPKA